MMMHLMSKANTSFLRANRQMDIYMMTVKTQISFLIYIKTCFAFGSIQFTERIHMFRKLVRSVCDARISFTMWQFFQINSSLSNTPLEIVRYE